MLVEAYNSIGKIKRYHGPLRQAYKIISNEFRGTNTSNKVRLQIAVKTINDSAKPDGIIPILLVFGTYPRMTNNLLLSPTTIKRTETIRKASNKMRKYYARRHMDDVLRTRNSPDITVTLQLPIQSKIKIWRENIG
jgi:hypothetical protein